ncbi:sugar transferase [bacterium]|nr:sugar transferase [bacterium]MBU1957965.1 sugar transferase [bacterium]
MTFAIKKFNPNIQIKNKSEFPMNKISKSYNAKGYTKVQYVQKRIIDVLVGSSLLLVTAPVILYSIYRIKKESAGSIFFRQSRIGLNGKAFICYKFRSMHTNSKFNPYTQENDSRIFPFGNTMRKMRIDELPQLLNILKGEMHLIGPRAEWDILVQDYEKIIPNYHNRHVVSPGITGLAQVCYPYGRNVEDAKKKLAFDMEYINNWSLWQEIKVVFKTIEVVLGKKGM